MIAAPLAASLVAALAAPAVPHLPSHRDPALTTALGRIGSSFNGDAAIFVEDLSTGAFAGWNEKTPLPAASTVKLGVIAEGIRRFGFGAGSPVDSDLRAIGEWSSNAAANRVFALVGGVAPTEAALRRLGMLASTYPQAYALDKSEQPAKKKKKVRTTQAFHTRVTTARDLARALFRLQSAAAGERWAIRATGLSAVGAQAALGYLALARTDSSLFSFPIGTRHAEKDGWLNDVRASAAIVYGRGDTHIVVVLLHRDGVSLAEARALGARVSQLAFR